MALGALVVVMAEVALMVAMVSRRSAAMADPGEWEETRE